MSSMMRNDPRQKGTTLEAPRAKESRLRRKFDMAEPEEDGPELGGRDVNQMAATGELNLRTWLDD